MAWDDPALGVDWPVTADQAVVSDKDQHGVKLSEALAVVRSATLEAGSDGDSRPAGGSQSTSRPADRIDVDYVGGERLPR